MDVLAEEPMPSVKLDLGESGSGEDSLGLLDLSQKKFCSFGLVVPGLTGRASELDSMDTSVCDAGEMRFVVASPVSSYSSILRLGLLELQAPLLRALIRSDDMMRLRKTKKIEGWGVGAASARC